MNLTMIFAMGIAVIGLFTGAALLFFAGMGVAAYTWFTRPRRYLIYANSLVIEYGRPRIKVISLAEISHLEMLSLPIGDRLRVVLLNGRRTMILAKDLDTFREKLDQALESYQGGTSGGQQQDPSQNPRIIDQAPEQPQNQPEDGTEAILDPDKKPDYEGPSPG
ncbi:MAG: hypothetical protein BZY88_05635 [SAR202 cluster bacterium Io17-Chloro-G9]|nr:MAG: hypothetical protein BZY88_05635 [SAR202 cluster bacterium Io17-Chloro-G9]